MGRSGTDCVSRWMYRKWRAYANQASADSALLASPIWDPLPTQSALGSGAVRVQFGLKLHAADPCNLVYVMCVSSRNQKLVVSVKSNPAQHRARSAATAATGNISSASGHSKYRL